MRGAFSPISRANPVTSASLQYSVVNVVLRAMALQSAALANERLHRRRADVQFEAPPNPAHRNRQ
jgi:hypothetical protein